MKFEWDEAKSESNHKKHQVRFEEAQTVFLDPHAVDFYDEDHSEDEDRFIRIGVSEKLNVPLVVFCERDESIFVSSRLERRRRRRESYMKKEYDLKSMKRRPGKTKVYPEAAKVAINIRLDAIVVNDLKDEAERMGIPYQTLINSILHRFATGQLVDRPSKKTGT